LSILYFEEEETKYSVSSSKRRWETHVETVADYEEMGM
jgi:hypothetical protein